MFDLAGGLPANVTVTPSGTGTGTHIGAGSGETESLSVRAKSYLLIDTSFTHTRYDDGAASYTTATTLPVALPSLRGLQLTNDYEGYTEFGLSPDTYSHYEVFTLTAPNRLVVDVYH